ncbi:secretin N-terminal domain-containing protein [Rugamonas sp. DEMB1]|uniref:secretin N-terminal domain-containing protein n=1 Tax=Rugamonas sp. DEMB1 TaxID=3039386 RepID=UPI00244C5571|nr:secretin N-terminal domain-containing protein [Rugamonas sp. DEMB1]WGG49111.1 secretin N-terminal domain-containing protein [Rugamonas sp. DEMB1]
MPSHPPVPRAARPSTALARRLPLPRRLLCLALTLALAGCASQLAYRDGRDLIARDQVEAGLLKLQEAVAGEPGNAQYKAAYLQARDRACTRYLEQAERQLAEGQTELAQQGFLRVQALDPANERARAGLRGIDMAARHDKLLAAAAAHLDKNEYEAAKNRLNAILTERPGNEAARQMLRLVLERSAAPPLAESGLAKAYKQPITIEFRDAPLRQVFEIISRRSGLNFVFDKDVKTDQKASIFLKNSTVESAIYMLLVSNQLEQQVMDANTVLIYPNVAAKLKEYQEMTVKTFFLANAEAKLVANTLKTILKTRDVVVDEKLNLLIVRDSPEAIRLAERLITLQDMPEAEVMLEVEILEVKRGRLMDLGVVWPQNVSLTPLSTSGGVGITIRDLNNLNQRTIAISGVAASINANKTDTDTNLLANPRIRVRNKEKAKIVIGDKVPVITTTISPGAGGFATESVSYVDVGLTLNAEPTIYLNNEVAIRVQLEVSNLVNQIQTKSGTTAYQIGTRQATTMLQLKDGENQVLAGLINNEERSTGNKLPGIGELPLLGRLFGSTRDDKQKTEIVLSITPHLIRNVQRPEAQMSEFSAGTESNFRRRPDLSVRAPAQLPPPPGARPTAPPSLPAPGSTMPAANPAGAGPAAAAPAAAATAAAGQGAAPAAAPPPAGAQPQALPAPDIVPATPAP